ncbi:MAG TPA: hypothetical protein PK954_22615 [Anaerolineales bacterium]|nr:hypothetical protein [Anaerolineales bacterium]HRF50166.1 hypothetical protein [Anaerolineales bacterium]
MTNMPSMDPSAEPTSDDKLWSLLAYVLSPLLPVIILLMEDKKNRPFIKSHNFQALVLGLANMIVGTLISFTVIGACVPVVVWFYMIYLGVQAYGGKTVTIPVITDFVKNQGWA